MVTPGWDAGGLLARRCVCVTLRWSLAPNARRSKQRCVQCPVHADLVAAECCGGGVVWRGQAGGGCWVVMAEEDGGVVVVTEIVLMQLGEGSAIQHV